MLQWAVHTDVWLCSFLLLRFFVGIRGDKVKIYNQIIIPLLIMESKNRKDDFP